MKMQRRLAVAVVLLFLALNLALIPALPRLTPLDVALLDRIHGYATPSLTLLAKTMSLIGSPRTLWPATLALAALLWLRRHQGGTVTLLATMAASGLVESMLKLMVRRPRPLVSWAYVQEDTFSFPSGHATLAVALYGLLLASAWNLPLPKRIVSIALSLTMTLSIGLSRLYLGAHHPSDVLAGYLTGAACLLTVLTFRNVHPDTQETGTATRVEAALQARPARSAAKAEVTK